MLGLRRLCTVKFVALFLVFLLGSGNFNVYPEQNEKSRFSAALEYFRNGLYRAAVSRLDAILAMDIDPGAEFKAKIYLVLGACCEKLGQRERARACFLELKRLVDKELIERLPEIPGLEPGRFSEYQEILGKGGFFNHREPVPGSEVLRTDQVIHAPARSIAEKKRGKKLSLLLGAGAVVTAVVMFILLAKKRSRQ